MRYTALDNSRKANNFKPVYNAGLYLRLSREDESAGQSGSITNQKEFLTSFVLEQGWNLIDVYSDDGFTGTNFNRPDFKRMLADIENRRINMVVTKDLSRLGRDYIDTGYYLERYFPEHNVRYIAVNDGIDTFADNGSNDMSPFKSVMNDMYAKDISKKVRTAIDVKRRNGQFIGAFAPYGYLKDPGDKNRIAINPETAPVVKRIFDLYNSGASLRNIACTLNIENVLSPAAYKKQKSNYRGGRTKSFCWSPETIRLILTNPTYMGHMTQNKCTKINYKLKKYRNIPKELWIVVKNTHEPIIDKETFEAAGRILERRANAKQPGNTVSHLFSGLLYCGDCGRKMTFLQNPARVSYGVCSGYKRFNGCTRHSIPETKLEEIVLNDLKRIAAYASDMGKFLDKIKELPINNPFGRHEAQSDILPKRLREIKIIIKKLYEDKLKGVLTDNDFMELSREYNREREQISFKAARLDREKKERRKNDGDDRRLISLARNLLEFNNVNKAVLMKLIDRIEVFENRKVRICYRFKNPF